jgi:acetyl-CoA carboxylase carboxyl transferase subunit alpha
VSRELDFERPVLELERQIEELRRLASGAKPNGAARGRAAPRKRSTSRGKKKPEAVAVDGSVLEEQISALEVRARDLKEQIFSSLTRWQIVQVARHPQRPYTLDYIQRAFTDFVELHGDRSFADDPSIIGGLARLRGEVVMVIGHQKGRTTNENLTRNFGMPRPEGYRKALRLMQLADRFGHPIVTLIDTPGAYPGIDAEERGQARAIAEALEGMAALSVPVVSVVIGEGGSGGALAIGVANRVLMLEHAIYSVISPEGCASILFKDASYAARAADAMKLTAPDLLSLGVIDGIIKEGLGGAHRDAEQTAMRVEEAVHATLVELSNMSPDGLRSDRYRRFRFIGEGMSA